jgi:hypothetical protein
MDGIMDRMGRPFLPMPLSNLGLRRIPSLQLGSKYVKDDYLG